MKTGIELIEAERVRQLTADYTAEHDDWLNKNGELADAAISYAIAAAKEARGESTPYLRGLVTVGGIPWPWEDSQWKPGSAIRNLVKAGALIAAEIDRRQRAGNAKLTREPGTETEQKQN